LAEASHSGKLGAYVYVSKVSQVPFFSPFRFLPSFLPSFFSFFFFRAKVLMLHEVELVTFLETPVHSNENSKKLPR